MHITTNEANGIRVVTSNINSFSVDTHVNNYTSVYIDNSLISFPPTLDGILHFQATGAKTWQVMVMLAFFPPYLMLLSGPTPR